MILTLLFAVSLASESALAAEANPTSPAAYDSDDYDRVDIAVKDGYIYITTNRPQTMRLYSILGQLVSQHNLAAGTTRIKAPARGVYILKIGDMTRRLNVN